ncbi:MAG TPA: threonine synthase [Thermoanaerobaculia bacterium]|nr:threonine synthase [Thermoanaerobaculia bacterium]
MERSGRWAERLRCPWSGDAGELDQPSFLSPAGRPWLVEYGLDATRGAALRAALPGRPWTLWRYRELLPLLDFGARVDLGEGGTPLVPLRRAALGGVEVLLKQEAGNPTGSFKDRGLSLAVNRARELGAGGVQLPSAGNAAIALAAYAAASGLPARVAMPLDTPRAVEERCRAYGAEVFRAGRTLVESGAHLAGLPGDFWTLATLKEPYRVEGKKTLGLELAEQLDWRLPDWIVYPTGGGTGIVGMDKAFHELECLGLLGSDRPRLVVAQAAGCAPLVRAFERGEETAEPWADARTRVWGLRVPQGVGDFLVLRALRRSRGVALAIDEGGLDAVAARYTRSEGLVIGPEGALALAALELLHERGEIREGQRVVVFQTGHPANYAEGV